MTTRQPPPAGRTWSLGRPFVLRVAGLPIEAVRELRCPDSRRWADEVLDTADRLHAEGRRIGDLLHDLVGGCSDDTRRRHLLALRREVFNNRLPRDPVAALALVASVDDGPVHTALAGWLAGRAVLAEREAEGADLLTADLERSRAALRRLAGTERLRDGLLLASPALDAQVDAFRAAGSTGAAPRLTAKRQRKIERSLLSYLYRTACKTSPFSTFTGVQLGTFQEPAEGGEVPTGRTVTVDDRWRSHTRLNVAALHRLAEAVVADPARRADLPVALASGWGRDDDRVRYVRRWVTTGDDDTAVTFDSVQDRLFYLRRSGTLDRMLDLLAHRPALRYGELVRWLADERADQAERADQVERAAQAEGSGQAEGDGVGPDTARPDRYAECERYLRTLLDVDMLQVPGLRIGVHDRDPLRAFQGALRDLDRPWAEKLAADLQTPITCVDRYPSADPEQRRALLAELRGALEDIQRGLGVERPRVPRTVLYEDAAAETTAPADLAAYTPLLAGELRSVERVLPAFDLTLPQRLTLKGFFLARYGRGGHCADLLKLVHDFHEDFFDQYLSFTSRRTAFDERGQYVPEENWLGLPQLKALDTARIAFHQRMRERWDAWLADREHTPGPDGAPDLFLDEEDLAEVAGELEPVAPDLAPQAHHLQLAERPDGPLLVLNRSYGGLSFPFSRFTHCFPEVAGPLRRATAEAQPPGAVFAEVTGGPVTSNLNLHDRLTDYEIVCPGESGSLPPAYQIPLEDLSLVHDEAADRLVLRSARLEREVIPVYLGYLVPLALPEIPRTLLLLSPTSMAPIDVWAGVPEGEPVAGVTRRPRVRHGRLVLSRRGWRAPAAALPLRTPGTPEAEWFLGWHRFRRDHGLPERVFATVRDSAARGATGAKPQYLDFDSALSLTAFEALLRGPDARVVFREALPDTDGLHAVSTRGHHVAELAVETVTAAPGVRGAERRNR